MMAVVIAIAAAMAVFLDIGAKSVNLLNEGAFFIKYTALKDVYYQFICYSFFFFMNFLCHIMRLKDIMKY